MKVKEKAHTRVGDALAAERRRLPVVEVDPQTPLIGADAPVRLIDVFDGRPVAEQCEGCTFNTSHITELAYLHSRDVSYAVFCDGPASSARHPGGHPGSTARFSAGGPVLLPWPRTCAPAANSGWMVLVSPPVWR